MSFGGCFSCIYLPSTELHFLSTAINCVNRTWSLTGASSCSLLVVFCFICIYTHTPIQQNLLPCTPGWVAWNSQSPRLSLRVLRLELCTISHVCGAGWSPGLPGLQTLDIRTLHPRSLTVLLHQPLKWRAPLGADCWQLQCIFQAWLWELLGESLKSKLGKRQAPSSPVVSGCAGSIAEETNSLGNQREKLKKFLPGWGRPLSNFF